MSEQVNITRLSIRNICGIERFDSEIGQVALFVGRNGVGKTSVLESIRTMFEGGGDPSLIHAGAAAGEITMELSNGYTAHKKITPLGIELVVRNPAGGIIKAPATYLKSLAPELSWDPIGFLTQEPKKRAEFLLKNLPLTFAPEEVNDALEAPVITKPTSLQELNALRDGKYAERTTVSRQLRDLDGTLNDMRRSLPPDDDATDWRVRERELNEVLSTIRAEMAAEASAIELEAEQRKTEKHSEITQKLAAIEKEWADFNALVDKCAAETLAEKTAAMKERELTLSTELGQAGERAEQQLRAAGVREAIDKREEGRRALIGEENRLSRLLQRLDHLKHCKLKELPIAGFDLSQDSKGRPLITIDGIPLDRLNRQQQLFVAIQAVTLGLGNLRTVLLEAAELDDDCLRELTAAAKDAGLQLVLARWVNERDLSVVDDEQYAGMKA